MRACSSPHGEEIFHEISASVWNRCPPSIVMHLGSYDTQRNPVANTNYNGWGIIVLITRYLHSGWMIVHLCFDITFANDERSIFCARCIVVTRSDLSLFVCNVGWRKGNPTQYDLRSIAYPPIWDELHAHRSSTRIDLQYSRSFSGPDVSRERGRQCCRYV
ncbi:hypothetical protein ANN_03618 [Periplaneta americana]|uniref:Uncharacterized protein n=1 Tax=Periplaneta americana TaxID=6978 RepID=A0ABQ8U361_PERAM|nr:hypothetical protein ANN_03618 [Periplaneta americana]